jgi:RND family efflux transporter MFP subunit
MDEKAALLEQLRITRPADPVDKRIAGAGRTVIVIGVALVVLFGLSAVGYRLFTQAHALTVRAVAVKSAATSATTTGPVGAQLLEASGYVVALRQATVSAKSIYKVVDILIQQGDEVKEGQVIATLDDSNVRASLEQSQMQVKLAQASLDAARVAVADAKPTLERSEMQHKEGLISDDAFDATKSSFDASHAAVEVAEQNLAVASAAVGVNQRFEDDTRIRAPFDGMVTAKNAQPGEIVSPQFLGGGGLAQIVDMNSLEVDVDVSENYISRVHPRQDATVTLDAYPDWHIPADVIAIIPTADRSKATVQVRVGFKAKDARVLPQMGAHVAFLSDGAAADGANAQNLREVIVDPEAIEAHGDTGRVFVIKDQTVEERSVGLGARTRDGQIVHSGLDPGMLLAVGDFSALHDGARIRVAH